MGYSRPKCTTGVGIFLFLVFIMGLLGTYRCYNHPRYRKMLIAYGSLSLLCSLLLFLGFILLMVAATTSQGREAFLDDCEEWAEGKIESANETEVMWHNITERRSVTCSLHMMMRFTDSCAVMNF